MVIVIKLYYYNIVLFCKMKKLYSMVIFIKYKIIYNFFVKIMQYSRYCASLIMFFFINFCLIDKLEAQLDGRNIYKKVSPAVVLIIHSKGKSISIGTGSIIRSDGFVITNHHVIEEYLKYRDGHLAVFRKPNIVTGEVKNDLKYSYAANVVAYSKKFDLALLKMINPNTGNDLSNLPILHMNIQNNIGPGSKVYALGHPGGGRWWTQTPGEIGGFSRNYTKIAGYDIYQHSAPINPGNSGGPLVNIQGQQVGVNTFINRGRSGKVALVGLNFAVTSNTVRRWLDLVVGENFLEVGQTSDHSHQNSMSPSYVKPFPDNTHSDRGNFSAFLRRLKNGSYNSARDHEQEDELTNKDKIDRLENFKDRRGRDKFQDFLKQLEK